jgi:acyl-CoA dehydrogenase
MINLETPQKLDALTYQAHMAAQHVLRPISRKYDTAEHVYPVELDTLAELVTQANAQQAGISASDEPEPAAGNVNGRNIASLVGLIEMCWGDVGLMLTMPHQGLGQAAIRAVATPDQLERFGGKWAAMAITEPEAGSDSAAIRTTAVPDGD